MDHVWSVLCLRASIDRETNNVSLFDVVEQIQVLGRAGTPGVVGPFELVSLWRRTLSLPERGQVRVSIRGPSGHLYVQQVQDIDLREFQRMRARFRITAIPIEGSGTYQISVELQQTDGEAWGKVANIPVEIELVTSHPSRARL